MNLNKAEFEAAFGTSSQLPSSDLPEIAFAVDQMWENHLCLIAFLTERHLQE